MTATIRDLHRSDEAAWQPLWADYLRHHAIDETSSDKAKVWRDLFETRQRSRVAMEGTRMLGIITWIDFPAKPGPGRDCHLEDFYVVSEKRGQGIGTRLFDDLMALARAEGFAALHCFPGDTDFAAMAIFARHTKPDRDLAYTIPL